MMRTIFCGAACAALALMASAVSAVELGAPFRDGVVLQRGVEVPVWGMAKAGNAVEVSFGGNTVSARVGADGSWRVRLPPMPASAEARSLVVTEKEDGFLFDRTVEERIVRDVLVGEVWICSGQSNMDCLIWGGNPRYRDKNGALVTAMSNLPEVRLFKSPYRASAVPGAPIDVKWRKMTAAETRDAFSAVGYYFARELFLALRVPVGIVDASWGGTNIDAWTPRSGYESCPAELKPVAARLDAFASEWRGKTDRMPDMNAWAHQPAVLWNGLVDAFAPMAVKGFLWYQGCTNHGEGDLYRLKLHALYKGWSTEFANPGLKMYLVELAPWTQNWLDIVEAQHRFVKEQPNAALASAADVGNFNDIHPNRKEIVARRLAVHALRRDYGFAIDCDDSPVPKRVEFKDSEAVVTFDHVTGWYVYNDDFSWNAPFQLAGADGVWHDATVVNWQEKEKKSAREGKTEKVRTYVVDGADLRLRSAAVPTPVAVRYMGAKRTMSTLYNQMSLPLGPFTWPND